MSEETTIATRVLLDSTGRERKTIRRYVLTVRAPGGLEQHELDRAVVRVGTREGADVVVADETMSRLHFEIVLDEHGYRLRDLGSTNGTFADGQRLLDGYLRPNATIRAGSTEIRFHPQPEETEVALSDAGHFGGAIGRRIWLSVGSRPLKV